MFGAGKLREIGPIARGFGRRALIVTGRSADRSRELNRLLGEQGIARWIFTLPGEPTIEQVQSGVRLARLEACDLVVAFGGGSAIDGGKAIAALMRNDGDALDYLEVIGRGQALAQPSAPFIAVPTTAGTGAEVTRNAVLASPQHRVKASFRSPLLLAKVAVVDPELTYRLPPAITASTGLDALTQLVEPYVSCRANPLTDAICTQGLRHAARSLRLAFEQSQRAADDPLLADGAGERYRFAREDMAVASLFGGLALANAGLGAVHGFAASIGGMFPAPHGAVCAALLPHVMEANARVLRARAPESESLRRFDEVGRLLCASAKATASDGIGWVHELCADLKIPRLSAYGISSSDFALLIDHAARASSMKSNPIPLTMEDMKAILEAAL